MILFLLKRNMKKRFSQHFKQIQGNWTVAEIEISYKPLITNHATITSSLAAYELIKDLWDNETICLQEQFAALFFNNSKKVIGWRILSIGTMTKCIVDIKLLLSLSLHCMATNVIVVHNHPSGNLIASQCDKVLTATVKDTLKLIDVVLLDHLIISENGYFSFSDEGML